MDQCGQCGMVGFHRSGCGLGQISAPLNRIDKGIGALAQGQSAQTAGLQGISHELALGNILSFAQLHVQSEQLHHLGQLNAQMGALVSLQHQQMGMQRRQMLEEQRQAALQQLLFETEQFLGKVEEVGRRDNFAAGVMAAMRLEGLIAVGVGPQHLTAIEHKRSLQAAVDRLTARWNSLAGAEAERGRACVKGFLDLVRHHQALGDLLGLGAVPAMQSAVTARVDQAEREVRFWWRVVIAGPVLIAVGVGLIITGFNLGAIWVLVGLALLVVGPLCLKYGRPYLQAARTKQARAAQQGAAVANYRAFMERADGGVLLAATLDEHPALQS